MSRNKLWQEAYDVGPFTELVFSVTSARCALAASLTTSPVMPLEAGWTTMTKGRCPGLAEVQFKTYTRTTHDPGCLQLVVSMHSQCSGSYMVTEDSPRR